MKAMNRKILRKKHKAIFKPLLALILVFFITGLVTIPLSAQNTWYVSPTGNDSNDGSSSTPWLTINFAVLSAAGGDTVKVMDDNDENTDDYIDNITIGFSKSGLVLMRADTVGPNPQIKASNTSLNTIIVFGNNITIDGLDIHGAAGSNRGAIATANISGLIVQNCRLGWSATKINARGAWLSSASSSIIRNNEITASVDAIYMQGTTTGNSFFNNTINGTLNAFNVESGAGSNRIYLNDITGSISSSSTAGNFWNSEHEKIYTHNGGTQFGQFLGNFYSSHSNTDTDANGLADASFSLPGNEPIDAFPLAKSRTNFETLMGSLILVEQVDTVATAGDEDIPILKVNIVVSGTETEVSVGSLTFDTDGSSSVSDIEVAYLWRTGKLNVFSTDTEYGDAIGNPDGEMMFSEVVDLAEGSNYYWLAYNASTNASPGTLLDAELTEVVINEAAQTLQAPDPVGSVQVDQGSDITGLSLFLDGANDYLNIPHGLTSNQFIDSLTIEFWINGSGSTNGIVLEKGIFDHEYYIKTSNVFGAPGTGYLRFSVDPNNTGGSSITTTQQIMDRKWHHFAVTLKSSTNEARIYVDGMLDNTNSNFTGNITLNAGIVTVGSRSGASAISANIDELRLWSTIRTQEQIQRNMYQKLVGNETGLAAYYTFDEFSTSTITDATGTANHGTLENGARLSTESHPHGTFMTGGEGWRILSSPFGNTSYSTLLDAVATQGFTGADSPSGTSNVYTWDESGQQFVSISDANNIPSAGTSFIAYVYDDDNFDEIPDGFPKVISIEKTQNNGTIAPTLSFTDTGNISDDGWNLVGNPYGASIDWDASNGLSSTNLDATIYVWDDSQSGGSGAYLTWNGITGTLDNGVLAPWQGFWVKANAANPSLSLSDTVRTGGGVLFKKALVPKLKLALSGNEINSETIIMLSNEASIQKDPLDAYKLKSLNNDGFSLYTLLENGAALDINALPVDLEETINIGLDFDGNNLNGDFELSWEQESFPDDWQFVLRDNDNGQEARLSEQTRYSFESSENQSKTSSEQELNTPSHGVMTPTVLKSKSDGSSRFTLIMTPGAAVSNEVIESLPTKIALNQNYPNPFNPTTTISFTTVTKATVRLEVFDSVGRKVTELLNEPKAAGRHAINFDASRLSSGLYFYRLQVGSNVFTKKMTLIK